MNYKFNKSSALKSALLAVIFIALQVLSTPLVHVSVAQEKTSAEETSKEPAKVSPATSSPKTSATKQKPTKAKDEKKPAEGITFSNPVQSKWKIGTRIIGGAAPARNILITIPVPNDWPEQSVSLDDVQVQSNSRVVDNFRKLDSGVRQLIVKMPNIGAREEVIVSVTCVVQTQEIAAPADTSVFLKPKTSHREGKPYMGVGPDINYRDSKLRKKVKELVKDKQTPWEEVETIFDWVRDNIEDVVKEPSDVAKVMRNLKGCNEDKAGLFVAMCRANKIPARIVWVEGTQYAEFMLADDAKNAHWFPCRPGGLREFGSMSEPRVVLQKGESIRVPEKDQRQKFVAEFVTCEGTSAASKPRVRFFRELLADD